MSVVSRGWWWVLLSPTLSAACARSAGLNAFANRVNHGVVVLESTLMMPMLLATSLNSLPYCYADDESARRCRHINVRAL